MLDKNTEKVLKILNSLCDEGTYKVIEFNSLVEKFPKSMQGNKELIDQIFEYLKAGQYIDVKYAEQNTYCLSVLPKGRMILEDKHRENKTLSRITKTVILNLVLSGLMAFLGAFLAVMLFK